MQYDNLTQNFEGVYQSVSINKDKAYSFSIRYTGKITVKFTTGLVATGGSTPVTIPTPTKEQMIYQSQSNSSSETEVFIPYIVADDNYLQLWIYASGQSSNIDDVVLNEACCSPNSTYIYQNTIDPPSRFEGDYIKAGENVISGPSTGPVVITGLNNKTIFQAGNYIELLPGFSTYEGVNFEARIGPCNQDQELTISI
ncbi:MAG: hypothetical protein KDC92_15825, partial [Bacteroidetes bacterium]|nr:hypothetical protein [Bacteroidota bacterium]